MAKLTNLHLCPLMLFWQMEQQYAKSCLKIGKRVKSKYSAIMKSLSGTLENSEDETESSPFRHLPYSSNIYVVHEFLIMFEKETFLVTVHQSIVTCNTFFRRTCCQEE